MDGPPLKSVAAATLNLANPSSGTGDAKGDTFANVERFEGSMGNDTLNGAGGNDAFFLSEDCGSDTISDYALGPNQADI